MDAREMWGGLADGTLERIVVVSPHFDDAALGACHVLASHAGSTVITVFGGAPPAYPEEVTDWDAAGGFVVGDDIVAVRRTEDLAAMEVMGCAPPVWLDFTDHQYEPPDCRPSPAAVSAALTPAIRALEPTAVFLPFGLANPDHVLAHDAGLLACEALAGEGTTAEWFCYEDAGYKHLPGLLAWRVSRLFRGGLWPTPSVVPVVADADVKRRAIWAYASQIGPLERDHLLSERLAAGVPEQYWRLAPPPAGWERLSSADDLDARRA